MKFEIKHGLLNSAIALILLSVGWFVPYDDSYAQQKNKLAEFKAFGQWEIWCIDMAQSGNIQCNLNQVLRYKNHPDFRAMIPRIYSDGHRITRLEIDREWQTGFHRGYIQVDDFDSISLSDCGTPCVLEGKMLSELINQFAEGKNATIHFHDYLVEEFDVDISLKEFSQALEVLKIMQP